MSRFPMAVSAKFTILLMMVSLCIVTAQAQDDAAEAPKAEATDVEPIGYFLGLSVGQQMLQNGFEKGDFNLDALVVGLQDGMDKKDAALSDEQLKETQAKIQALLGQRQEAAIEKMKAAGVQYLAKNKDEEGVVELESGLQYKVIDEGDGEMPGPTDTVVVHYTGKLINGQTFDSSVTRGEPAKFRVNQVIQGWQEGLQKMKVGSKWKLYIPSDLAYGAQGSRGAIGPHQVLVFDVELLEIQ
ncbi:FKBP-type peptidyl-prolyl cis-trans isomerase [Rubripirellula amarantea]|uniref:Peptidyl-prolyl cis-trans isomerase n=1 Tax=Rubripirellula amarantea TaxID=2527999 RepID=A0A5C5WVX6_9BACT|nr:FKBP-type peptidyl-prolyl cis-trans isomerase [Rubripirellula amarantea]MDA8744036.1 FKBP-type peptidyl-prolyl cis-trans isomerase [Rubripirellula amarantea]TWT54291.1 FKBP-type 22 kDa peptidyl-prolyl cis-trans isomerase [Rubripirellula amarantea]